MASKFELLCLFVMFTVTFSSGEMFLERGVYNINMTQNSMLSIQKSLFANSEIGVRVLSCTSNDKNNPACDLNIEWTIRQSDCDGVYNYIFQDLNDTATQQTLRGLYENPNCYRMEEEQSVSYLQSWHFWPNEPIHVEKEDVKPEFLRDLNTTGMDCSVRSHERKTCNKLTPCGAGINPSSLHNTSAVNSPSTGENAEKTQGNAEKTGEKAAKTGGNPNGSEGNQSARRKRDNPPEDLEGTAPKEDPKGTAPTEDPKVTAPTSGEEKKPKNGTKRMVKSRVIHTNDRDGRFIFILAMNKTKDANVKLKIELKSPSGYLSATQYPLLPFYGTMCAVYSVFGLVWLVLLFRQWKDLLRVQFWISVVIILGLIEKAAFVAEFDRHNKTGESSNTGVFIAEELSVLKRTVARMLVIIVSLGYGITRPRLGRDLNWVMGAGSLFFVLSSMEVYFRITQSGTNGLIALLPLSILDAVLCWWIFRSLVETTRTLRLRRNLVKLWLYRHLTNALIFCVVAAVIFLIWSLKVHKLNSCVKEWNEIWLDDAYWHILFCVILMVIMILIRPSANNQRYAYSILNDGADEDEESKEPMMNDAFETVKMRNVQSNKTTQDRRDEEDLQWVEDNIPAAVADAALGAFDDSEEELITSVERSKME